MSRLHKFLTRSSKGISAVSRFVQLHILTFYPPSNLNRDDTGRPKSAIMGGVERLRVSSQAIKRAVRTSEVFQHALEGHLGERTQRFGEDIEAHLVKKKGAPLEKAREIARSVAKVFGKVAEPEKAKGDAHEAKGGAPIARTAQLAFIGPEERQTAISLAESLLEGNSNDIKADQILRRTDTAVDIAMFGRMLADNADFNREASVQIAHAVTTHKVTVEDDFYTAVDDLKAPSEDAGAGFMGELGFGSGVFYLYVCIDKDLLVKNLGGDAALAAQGLEALTEALATVSPTGKQASFASRARASFILAEKGDQQPRTLAAAFVKPVEGNDILGASIKKLQETRDAMDKAYNPCSEDFRIMEVTGKGSLAEIKAFVAKA
jgi:CRISPR system Cascade subunit CasC